MSLTPGMAMQSDEADTLATLAALIEQWAEARHDSIPFCATPEEKESVWAIQREVVDLLSKAQRLMIEEAVRHADRVSAYDKRVRPRAYGA